MKKLIICGLIIAFFASCGTKEAHFINDTAYRDQVSKQFNERREMAKNRAEALFSVFDQGLTTEQSEALMFLYAYMPLNDLADYDGEFYLKQVNTALAAREAFEWGKTIPEDIFRHFVLPYRVNNENLDTARMVFFTKLKERLKGLSMYDAALEVNHWCHEQVTYQPTDIRTSSPLSTIRTAWGRCGEESTFTVTAMRAAGIPARQCYTPRWAHTDDNHAWVEVWIDGKWYYLGACEPEPELNMAWFSAPAKRAMMVHTNVFGEYNGNEETMIKTHIYSKINLLANYAPTKQLVVNVVDTDNKPVANVHVEYKLYNYSEFYNMATKTTDNEGKTSLRTGFGDLLVWAKKDGHYGYVKVDRKTTGPVSIMLNRKPGELYTEDLDIVPPVPLKKDEVSTEKERINNQRLKQEDSIRGAYEASFPKREQSDELAKKLGLNNDRVWNAVSKSYGNWREISKFMESNRNNELLFDILEVVLDKDLRDTPADILNDHLLNCGNKNAYPVDIFVEYVLNPRVRNEIIAPWRSFLQNELPTHARENVNVIVDWVQKNIMINTNDSYYNCPITPIGVYNLRVADQASRDIFFVALCRASGIAARVDAATAAPQVYENGEWRNIVFETKEKTAANIGVIVLKNLPSNTIIPKYYVNYTLARYINGDFVTLDYEDSPLVAKFPVTLKLEEGYYRLTTGNRTDDGSILTKMTYFDLPANETVLVDAGVRPIVKTFDKKGTVSLQQHSLKTLMGAVMPNLHELADGKGLALLFIDPTREPSRHVMNDIPLQREMFEKWGGNMLFVLPNDKLNDFNALKYKGLPKQSVFAVDENRAVMKALFADMKTDFIGDFPVIWLLTPQGDVVLLWQGYRIGIGEDMVKALMINKLM
ncbi:MAG: transglutaminase-like domain-containing protein [Prevotellaceae bacterium]|jgi:transglutaminase-like putative cysteine protease|nr:transglutaminase-like domain-containing protein [Prevotellaceae bacterium]